MIPLAIFYHTLFFLGDRLLPHACEVTNEQMDLARRYGLLDAAEHFVVGINGGNESKPVADLVIPPKATRVMHGLESRNENLTLIELEKFVIEHPGWLILYFHAKGSTRATDSQYDQYIARWRNCMMTHTVLGWRKCIDALRKGFEAAGAHWMLGAGPDRNQNLFAGNFWWATSNYLRTLPSILRRDRIRISGVKALESRYEAEVWIGNGSRLPKALDLHRATARDCPFDPSRFMRG